MVDRSDLVVFCVEHNSGGAYQTMQYAKKANTNIVNLSVVQLIDLYTLFPRRMIMNRKKTFSIVLAIAVVAVGVIFALASQKEKEMNPEEFLERFEKAAEEVFGEDIQQVSKTELVATLTYGHETDNDNNIYYRILKTTYGEAGDPSSVTGLNTDALNVLFPVDMMDSCEELMIQDCWCTLQKR